MAGVVVLISGRGSNMRALVEAGMPVQAVVSNRPDAAGLAYAGDAGIRTVVVDHRQFAQREAFDVALADLIDGFNPSLVVLAGFMRVLGAAFVRRFDGCLVNIHPSLLPAFPGLHTHERALDAGIKVHGATVHFVTPELDAGPIIAQAVVPVLSDDTPEILAARVLHEEHVILPRAVRWLLEGQVRLVGMRVEVPGQMQWHASRLLMEGARGAQ